MEERGLLGRSKTSSYLKGLPPLCHSQCRLSEYPKFTTQNMVCKVRKNKVHESSVRRATEVGNLLTDIFFDIESPSGLTVLKRGSPYTELNTFCLS